MAAHWAVVKPGDSAIQAAVEDLGLVATPPRNSALEPSKEATPAVVIVPSASTRGRCWVSLPAPKKRPAAYPAEPVENGYGRPDWSCPTKLNPRLLVNQRRKLVSVTFPESSTTPKLAAWRMSLNAGPSSALMFLGSPGSERPKKSSPEVSACDQV